MKNKDIFVKEVEDGSMIRYEINEDHAPIIGKLSKIYKGFFGRDPREFRYAKDILYYKGGWPSPNTPPRAKSLADRIADAYMILSYIGKDNELKDYLAARGLKLEPIDDSNFDHAHLLEDIDWTLDSKREKAVRDTWEELFDTTKIPTDPKEVLNKLMDVACNKQEVICGLADQIKIDKGGYVEEECEIKVSHYTKAVNLKYRKTKGQDINDALENIEQEVEDTSTVLEYFDNEDEFAKKEKEDE